MVTVQQHYLDCLAQAGYTITSGGMAFVIDPRRDVDEFVKYLEERNLRLVGVLLTHLHADFVAGHQELARRFGAPLYLGRGAGAEYPHIAIHDGMELTFGDARLVFWETPGHTPGDVSTLLFAMEQSPTRPQAVFTGDTLFNGDVGRPDLLASFGIDKETLVEKLFHSTRRLMTLPDETILYPGHGAGSLCGKNLSQETVSTIGQQRAFNYALKAETVEEFSRLVTAGQSEPPRYFETDAVLNKKGIQDDVAHLLARAARLSAKELRSALEDQDAYQLLDTRTTEEFARGFLPGFVNVSLQGTFATWAGTLLSNEKPVVIVASSEARAAETVVRLARVGIENIKGYFVWDETHPRELEHPLASFEHLAGGRVKELVEAQEAILVDVRTPSEAETSGVLPGAISLPLQHLDKERIEKALPDRNRPYVVYCAGGYRSSIAASILVAHAYKNVADLAGGYANYPR